MKEDKKEIKKEKVLVQSTVLTKTCEGCFYFKVKPTCTEKQKVKCASFKKYIWVYEPE